MRNRLGWMFFIYCVSLFVFLAAMLIIRIAVRG
jgi:hypothetical protein